MDTFMLNKPDDNGTGKCNNNFTVKKHLAKTTCKVTPLVKMSQSQTAEMGHLLTARDEIWDQCIQLTI